MERRDIARRTRHAEHARRAQASPEQSTEEQLAPADPAPEGPAATLKGAAAATAVNAARGAMTGGAVGAARAVAIGALRDKNSRKIILTAIAILAGLSILISMIVLTSISNVSMALVQEQQNTNSQQSASEAGIDQTTMQAVNSNEHDNLPWPLQAAALDTNPDADMTALETKLDELDRGRLHRDFTLYATRSDHSPTLVQQLDENPGKDYYATHEAIHLEALVAAGLTDSEAAASYKLAMKISLGENGCVAPGPAGEGDGETFEYDGTTYESFQVANMKTLIGLAKTMFPNDWQKAAVIGLITARVESRFQNYANDGKVGSEDRNMAPYTASDYSRLAYSLELPHDAVGSDHASVGIMQQQATYWGQLPGSTFDNDVQGVLKRLMTPAYAGALFYERLPKIADWQNKNPGEVAQRIQVSAFPDAYQEHIALAEAILAEYGSTASAVDVPKEIGWGGESGDGDTNGDGNVTQTCGEQTPGTGGVPTGTEQELAQALLKAADEGRLIWYAPAPEGYDQIKAYADGDVISADCTLDVRVLQLLVMTSQEFNEMSVNSLNRRCTGSTAGIGKASAHWRGQAADIGHLNGTYTTGDPASAESYQWWEMFARVASGSGGGLGQSQCRTTSYPGIADYVDGCNHLHFEIGRGGNTEPLKG